MGRPPIGRTPMTGAERQRRRRARLARQAPPVARARGPERIAELEREVATLRAELADMAQAFRNERKRRTAPKQVEKPAPPTPDEERDRQIKGLRTANANLRAKLRGIEQAYQDSIALAGGMPRKTQNAIDLALHPDRRGYATEADKDLACKLWNSWKDDQKKVRPR